MARAKIFKHGGSQAVRLPKEFRFEVAEVDIRKEGDAVVLRPVKAPKRSLEEWAAFWAKIDELGDGEDLVLPPQPQLRDFEW